MNRCNTLTSLIAAALLTAAPTFAHAVVRTESGLSESMAGASETYRLNVPVEKDMATTEVRLMVPAGVTITRFQVMPGFVRSVKKDDAGLITEITWKGRIAPVEYARFFFQARNPAAAGDLSWNVYQKYADGKVVAWDGTDPQMPTSKTTVK